MIDEATIAYLKSRYTAFERTYHNWRHIEEMLHLFKACNDLGLIFKPAVVEAAIYFHDAVYEAQRSDNEHRSAKLMNAMLGDQLESSDLHYTWSFIEMTARHHSPLPWDGPIADDARLFLDMDLAILGADAARFQEYEDGIRKEYSHVPERQYLAGRTKVLKGFLARDRIFLSDTIGTPREQRARFNLQDLIVRLEHRAGLVPED